MQTINCYIPLKIQQSGELSEDDWTALEDALVAVYKRIIERSLTEITKSGIINIQAGVQEEAAHVGWE